MSFSFLRHQNSCFYTETLVSYAVKQSSRKAALDTSLILLFHRLHGANGAPPTARWSPAHAVELARARVAPIAVAGGGPVEAIRLSPARHSGAVRRLPVAGSGNPAGGRRGDAHTGPADRERRSGRRATPVPRAAG